MFHIRFDVVISGCVDRTQREVFFCDLFGSRLRGVQRHVECHPSFRCSATFDTRCVAVAIYLPIEMSYSLQQFMLCGALLLLL